MTLHLDAVAILSLGLALSFAVAVIVFQARTIRRLRRIEGLIRHFPHGSRFDIFKFAAEVAEAWHSQPSAPAAEPPRQPAEAA